jgi:hypothetical protein
VVSVEVAIAGAHEIAPFDAHDERLWRAHHLRVGFDSALSRRPNATMRIRLHWFLVIVARFWCSSMKCCCAMRQAHCEHGAAIESVTRMLER